MRPLTALFLLTCLACAAAPRQQAFDPAVYAPYAVRGTAVLDGQAAVQDDEGGWHEAAGREVMLQPVTPYALEWYERSVLDDEDLGAPDPRLAKFVRTVVADAEGGFRFAELPGGEYLLTCRITWTTAGLEGRFVTHGAWAHVRLSVPAASTVHIVMDR